VALVSFGIATVVRGHSWIHCTDYRGSVETYEPDQCFAHPRPKNGAYPQEGAFGVDRGFDTQTGSCQSTDITSSATYPAATYKRGQVVTLAWPSKNHVAAECTNPFIPDTSTKLFVATQAADPTFTTEVPASFSLDPHVQGVIDFKGFQNCPRFCDNTDKSLCTGTFEVPANLADGTYSFQWNWVFNQGSPPYISCFEATIAGDETNAAPAPTPADTPTPPPTTPRPTTATEAMCGAAGDQCDGALFSGVNCCQSGLQCFRQSQYFSQCLETCPEGGDEPWECSESEGCVGLQEQCDGEYYWGAKCCTTGSCYRNSPYYSQCRRDCPSGWECAGTEEFGMGSGGVSVTTGLLFTVMIIAVGALGLFYGRFYERKHPKTEAATPKQLDGADIPMDYLEPKRKQSSLYMPETKRHVSRGSRSHSQSSTSAKRPSNAPPPPPPAAAAQIVPPPFVPSVEV